MIFFLNYKMTSFVPDYNGFTIVTENCINKWLTIFKIYNSLNNEESLKYELENNINLVSFEKGRMEIAFNESLDKDFIKELSNKLFEWTNIRWIITLSKKTGEISLKEKDQIKQKKIFDEVKKSEIYKKVMDIFPDAELIDVKINNTENDD